MPSTVVRDIVYDPMHRTLLVTFLASGRRYAYRGVPPELYESFRRAFSKGRFFNAQIRDAYPCEQVSGTPP